MDFLDQHPFSFTPLIQRSLEFAVSYVFTEAGEGIVFERFIVQCMNLIKMIVKNYAYKPSKNIEGTAAIYHKHFYILKDNFLVILNSKTPLRHSSGALNALIVNNIHFCLYISNSYFDGWNINIYRHWLAKVILNPQGAWSFVDYFIKWFDTAFLALINWDVCCNWLKPVVSFFLRISIYYLSIFDH